MACISADRAGEILVALHSGMRRSEQYLTTHCPEGGLKWEHINFHSGVITLPRSKHGESRHIPMNSVLRKAFQNIPQTADSPYVFSEPPDQWFPKACKQAKVTSFTWHCLRHTFASRLVMAGVDIRTVQELLGHKSIVTTMRYAHLAPGHQVAAVECLVSSTSTATSTKSSEEESTDTSESNGSPLFSGARGRNRTGTNFTVRGILSPLRLPVPPPGLAGMFNIISVVERKSAVAGFDNACRLRIRSGKALYYWQFNLEEISRVVRVARMLAGIGMVLLGIIGLILPVMPGWIFLIPGLVILGREFKWARDLLDWLKKIVPKQFQGQKPTETK